MILLQLLKRRLQRSKGKRTERVGHAVHGRAEAGAGAGGCVGTGGGVASVVLVIVRLVSLAGEQGDVDFLDHLHAVQHFA